MKTPLDHLLRLAASVRPQLPPPSADLEERILADWRTAPRSAALSDFGRELRLFLLGAAAVLLVTGAITLPILTGPSDPSVLLTNSALQNGFIP